MFVNFLIFFKLDFVSYKIQYLKIVVSPPVAHVFRPSNTVFWISREILTLELLAPIFLPGNPGMAKFSIDYIYIFRTPKIFFFKYHQKANYWRIRLLFRKMYPSWPQESENDTN